MGFVKDAIPLGSSLSHGDLIARRSCSSNTSFAGEATAVCNYTARAFRALTYLSPGKERDERQKKRHLHTF